MTLIAICVCTYQRQKLLNECLMSLQHIGIPNDVSVTVMVIDNDVDESSRQVVEANQKNTVFTFHYVVEPNRGIPCARNRAITESMSLNAEYLVFIDDDERVAVDWLSHLFVFCQSHGGDVVVSGHVIQEIPESTPKHIRSLFEKPVKRQSGDRLNACATNNVIIPMEFLRKSNLRFDESQPFAGGTDTRFFVEATAKGIDIVKCMESVVYETIPESRATLGWFSKRKYRAGITEAWRKQEMGRSKINVILSSFLQLLLNGMVSVFCSVFYLQEKRNQSWLKVCRSFGVLMGVFGVKIDSYKKIH